jgi:hypothetical protein
MQSTAPRPSIRVNRANIARPTSATASEGLIHRLSIAGLLACLLGAAVPAVAAGAPVHIQATQQLAVLSTAHGVHVEPEATAAQTELVPATRPLTGEPTTLPVIGALTGADGVKWLRVMLPGRPDGSTGWIAQQGTSETVTNWHIVVNLAARRVRVYREGHVARTFQAVVGKSSAPTPAGEFFVEETLQMPAGEAGGPFALALSARSNVLQEFEGGPARSRFTAATSSAGRWARRPRTAASAWPPRALTGWPNASARERR